MIPDDNIEAPVVVNHVVIAGRISSEPTYDENNGDTIVTFRLEVPRINSSKPKNYFTVKAWQPAAIFAKHQLSIGHRIMVTGKLDVNTMTTEEGKNKEFCIIASRFSPF